MKLQPQKQSQQPVQLDELDKYYRDAPPPKLEDYDATPPKQ